MARASTSLGVPGGRGRAQGAVAVSDEAYARAGNNGRRRTTEKRELLHRIDPRARAAGVEPLEAEF